MDWKRRELADALTAAGVPAAPVQDAADLLDHDPQLRRRGHWVHARPPGDGRVGLLRHPLPALEDSRAAALPAPLLGADTHDVCTRLLGLDEAELPATAAKPERSDDQNTRNTTT